MLKIKYNVYSQDIKNPNDFIGYIVEDENKRLLFLSKDTKEELSERFEAKSALLTSQEVLQALGSKSITESNSVKDEEISLREVRYTRKVSSEFKYWLKYFNDKVLMVKGARQVGKTFEIRHFAEENFKNVIYINLGINDTFIKRMESIKVNGTFLREIQEFCEEQNITYTDDINTVIIIDEVQISKKVYNLLRSFRNELNCKVIMIGSYLGFLIRRDVFQPMGDTYDVEMTPLTFEEFCWANNVEYTQSDKTIELYNLYRKIGGYPSVLTAYQRTHNLESCFKEIDRIWDVFCKESMVYTKGNPAVNIYKCCINKIISTIQKEKKGLTIDNSTIENIIDIVQNSTLDYTVNNKTVKSAIVWLEQSGIIGLCPMHKTGSLREPPNGMRFYLRDTGLAYRLCIRSYIESTALEEFLSECFVYNELRNNKELNSIDEEPHCATYNQYELDFIIQDMKNQEIFGIEVKTSNSSVTSLKEFKRLDLINIAIKVAMTKYSIDNKGLVSYPIYLIGKLDLSKVKTDLQSN